jgi:hypothetical protein
MTSLWEVLQYRKTGKSFTRMPSEGRYNNKATITKYRIGSISKMFTSVLILKPSKKEIKSESNY